ncbi:hypothetical protein [Compostimonas suwonensis]|uniref:Uncharacterized protein n=1 Tax=Compostimonas suwonensis TaxID=1048394 RepID=A0A2M9C4U5_9MICO|nr:hypothetical protein [Compostimonas suwonensis]PJJ65536.1 hypothetical protein CLV54_0569 [Compostimonas suwonensis]
MKSWSFERLALVGFASSALCVLLLIVNAVTGNAAVAVLLPIAILALAFGGFCSVRAQIVRSRNRRGF